MSPKPTKKLGKVFRKAAAQRKEPLWKGPEVDGITQSLLGDFLECRERFRLKVVEGLALPDSFQHRREYGNMWHVCEEYNSQGQAWEGALALHCRDLCKRYRTQQEQIQHWYEVCKLQFPIYLKYWAKHPDEKARTPVMQEQTFKVPYQLPSGRTVLLRGKWDAVDLIGKGKTAGVYLQENKTKGEIEEEQLKRQLSFDLQTMFYLVALAEDSCVLVQDGRVRWPAIASGSLKVPSIRGVRYNVVRRPLSGGIDSIKQCKGESKEDFYKRLAERIADHPQHYFMRWKVEVSQADIERFKHEFLNPILEQLCDWWAFITNESNLADPFRSSYQGIHWRTPYGAYSALVEGRTTEFDEYLATGSTVGLVRTDNLFPELT